jgi:hypothetical protein
MRLDVRNQYVDASIRSTLGNEKFAIGSFCFLVDTVYD